MLLLLLLEQLGYELAIELSVLVTGLELQRTIVGLDCLGELPRAGQRIAPVVIGIGAVDSDQRRGALIELSRPIAGGSQPLGILEQGGCLLRRILLHRPVALLIRPQPEVAPLERERFGVRDEACADNHIDPAAPETQSDERQQQEAEPDPLVAPDFRLALTVGISYRHFSEHVTREESIDIGITSAEHGETAAAGSRHALETIEIELRDDDLPGVIGQEAAAEHGNRRAFRSANGQHMRRYPIGPQRLRNLERAGRGNRIGNEQYLSAGRRGPPQELRRFLQPHGDKAAATGHDVRAQRVDERSDRSRVAGQRSHREGVGRKHDERRLSAGPPLEQIEKLESCPRQPCGLDIGRIHGTRKIERDDERLIRPIGRDRQAIPGWPGQRNDRRDRGNQRGQYRPAARANRLAGAEDEWLQRLVDDGAPSAAATSAHAESPGRPERNG